jgi:hypothetical protein
MKTPEISHATNYNQFVQESRRNFPTYAAYAAGLLARLTEEQLVQGGASRHPDGFIKFPIGPPEEDSVKSGQLRLHFWLPNHQASGEPHEHPWHLLSGVLLRSYREFRPLITRKISGPLSEYQVNYLPGANKRDSIERLTQGVLVQDGPEYTYSQGEVHTLPANAYHKGERPHRLGAITLASMSPRLHDYSRFIAAEQTPFTPGINETEIAQSLALAREFSELD